MMVCYVYNWRAVPALQADLKERGFAVHVLDGSSIADEASFLQAFARDVPFEVFHPGDLIPPVNWNAFGDCLSSGLGARPETQAAILWEGADRMLDGNLTLLLEAVEYINREADRVWRYDPPIKLLVCLVGDGPNFPDDYSTRPLFGRDAAEIPVVVIRVPRVNGDKEK